MKGDCAIAAYMKRLSHTGRQIRELVEAVNAAVERIEAFIEACEVLEQAIGFNSAALIPFDPQSGAAHLRGHLLLNARSAESLLFAEYYARLDPLYTRWILNLANVNRVARTTDFVSAAELASSEFGTDFLRRVPACHILGGAL